MKIMMRLRSILLPFLLLWTSTSSLLSAQPTDTGVPGNANATAIQALFVNEMPDTTIDIYWENNLLADDHPDRRKFTGRIGPRGGYYLFDTFSGHEFSYELNGVRYFVNPKFANAFNEVFIVIAGGDDDSASIKVRCEITTDSHTKADYIDFTLKPYWAPRAASHFLELVRQKYYNGIALNRVVPNLLTQFGIASDHKVRSANRREKLLDDFDIGIKFETGYMSFAGTGPDSRTTEVFVVMPGVNRDRLDEFGDNPWETPFGYIENVESSAVTRIYSGYGDMPPWGNGPDTSKIYEPGGYTDYLPKGFPMLDYIRECYIIAEVGIVDDFAEGEL